MPHYDAFIGHFVRPWCGTTPSVVSYPPNHLNGNTGVTSHVNYVRRGESSLQCNGLYSTTKQLSTDRLQSHTVLC